MGQLNVVIDSQPVSTIAGVDPSYKGVYLYDVTDVAGTGSANNYLSIFNPIGSGRTLVALGFTAAPYAAGNSSTASSLQAFRITAVSGGTLISPPNVHRFSTAFADPLADVRTTNPTATIDATFSSPLLSVSPPLNSAGGQGSTVPVSPTPGASFVFNPGQGVVFRAAASDANQRWNIQFVWGEK